MHIARVHHLASVILVTGAAGFIGSVFVGYLNAAGYDDLLLLDDFTRPERDGYLAGKRYRERLGRDTLEQLTEAMASDGTLPDAVFHLGARTDTAEPDADVFERLNVQPSKHLWRFCAQHDIPFLYASSASTYGDGAHGYRDGHAVVDDLVPLNAYARSKQEFDRWALRQNKRPSFWAGLKFFNVYGPNEGHKGRMASVVLHAYHQIGDSGAVKLFRSHREGIEDGHQSRDFVYVRDVCDMLMWLWRERPASGLYNVGTGVARTFADLAGAVFSALGVPERVEYVDTPVEIRDAYQYYTQADMGKLRQAGYRSPPTTLEEGVEEYVREFLSRERTL